MSTEQQESRSSRFFKGIKNLFWLLLVLQFIPLFFSNMRNSFQEMASPKEHIGYLTLKGQIHDTLFLCKHIRSFESDESIKGILIRCDSPGGAPGSSQALYSEIKRCKKPVVFFVENTCASGAYYAALGADEIIANPISTIGSIGAIMQIPNVKGLLENWQVGLNVVNAGKYKDVGNPTKELTEEERAYLQAIVDDSYAQFVEDVAEERSIKLEEKDKWANGRVFTGRQALELELIDSLGSFSDAIEAIKGLAQIEGDIKLIAPKKPSPLIAALTGTEPDHFESEEMSSSLGIFISSAYSAFIQHQLNNQITSRLS